MKHISPEWRWCQGPREIVSPMAITPWRQTIKDDDVIVFLDAFDVFPNGLDGHESLAPSGERVVSNHLATRQTEMMVEFLWWTTSIDYL